MNSERFTVGLGAALVGALGLVWASWIGGAAFIKGKRSDQTIVVTGSARKRIRSDLVIWKAGVSFQATALADAYRSLAAEVPRVKSYLIGKGVPENQITISSIAFQTLHAKSNEGGGDQGAISGYSLGQEFEVGPPDYA